MNTVTPYPPPLEPGQFLVQWTDSNCLHREIHTDWDHCKTLMNYPDSIDSLCIQDHQGRQVRAWLRRP